MADNSGRTDLAVGDIAESGGTIAEYTAGGSITKGQVVAFSGSMTVVAASAATDQTAGVALRSASSGQTLPVLVKGVVKVTAGGAITVGNVVTGSTGGKVAAVGGTWAATMGGAMLGQALNAASADGDLILVRVNK
jgi:hypothetical protein